MTEEEMLDLAEKHLEVLVDDYEGIEYFSSTKKQMVEFALKIHKMGYNMGRLENPKLGLTNNED
jgi:hypothetical protein